MLTEFINDEGGATLIEYGMLGALLFLIAIACLLIAALVKYVFF